MQNSFDQSIPSAADFGELASVDLSNYEVVRQPLYDFLLYPTAGQQQFNFFSTPVGAGITSAIGGVVGTTKTNADTNMQLAGQLPNGWAFMVETIEVLFYPGSVATANTYTPQYPNLFAAANAAAVTNQLADVESIRQSGWLAFNISAKNYLTDAPLGLFPPKTQLTLDAALATTSATAGEIAAVNAKWTGRPYIMEPAITLQPGVNFVVQVNFPGAVATPSGFNARMGVRLDGYLLRARQ